MILFFYGIPTALLWTGWLILGHINWLLDYGLFGAACVATVITAVVSAFERGSR